jgi:hypothetical protein
MFTAFTLTRLIAADLGDQDKAQGDPALMRWKP